MLLNDGYKLNIFSHNKLITLIKINSNLFLCYNFQLLCHQTLLWLPAGWPCPSFCSCLFCAFTSSLRCCVTICAATTAPSWRSRSHSSPLWQSVLPTSCASGQMVASGITAPCRLEAAWPRKSAARCTNSVSKEVSTPWATPAVKGRTVIPAWWSGPITSS